MLNAIQGDGFSMVCQAIIDLENGDVVGFKSLSRFNRPPVRLPDEWFRLAGVMGLRRDLEVAAVRAALDLIDRIPQGAYLSLNISPDIIGDEELGRLLAEAPVERIVIEITEQIAIDDYERLNAALGELRRRGLRVALDDAGSGFAGMAHVVRLRPDVIKLDRTLVTGIESDSARQAFVSSLLSYTRATGGSVIAEGVETEAEAEVLRRLGVHWAQGYLFARPAALVVGADAVTKPVRALVRKGGRRAVRAKVRRKAGRIASRLVAAALVLSALMMPATAMAQNAQPGNPMWQVKVAMERVRLAFDTNPARRVELHLEFASRRVDEIAAILASGENHDLVPGLTRALEAHLSSARRVLSQMEGHLGRVAKLRTTGALEQYASILQAGLSQSCAGNRGGACEATRRAISISNGELKRISPAKPSSSPRPAASPSPHRRLVEPPKITRAPKAPVPIPRAIDALGPAISIKERTE